MRYPEIPPVFKAVYEDGEITVNNPERLIGEYVISVLLPASAEADAVINENGDIHPLALTDERENGNYYCFPASLSGEEKESIRPVKSGGASPFVCQSETVRTLEGEHLFLTQNENGTLVISSKDSGNVFFEMLTLISVSGKKESGYYTESTGRVKFLRRVSSSVHGEFHAVIAASLTPENAGAGFCGKTEETDVFLRIFFGRSEPFIRVSASFIAPQNRNSLILRLPTGTAFTSAVIDGKDVIPSGKAYFESEKKLVFSDENGTSFSVYGNAPVLYDGEGNLDLIISDGKVPKCESSAEFIITP